MEFDRVLKKQLAEMETNEEVANTLAFRSLYELHVIRVLLVWVMVIVPLLGLAATIMIGIMASAAAPACTGLYC